MTALWFACQIPKQPDHGAQVSWSGVLLAINTAGWKRFGRNRPEGTHISIENASGWELDTALRSEEPFVVESLLPNDRLRAQEGFFIAGRVPPADAQSGPFKSVALQYERVEPFVLRERIHMNSSGHKSWEGPLPFVAVKIRSMLKGSILQRLENSYNRHSRVLFPDFAGFRDFSESADPREQLREEG
jgi:hypothetical protein